MTSDTHLFLVPSVEDQLLADLKGVIRRHSDAHPRSQQTTLGPSEVGHPCLRKMVQGFVFGSGGTSSGDTINPPGDPLPAYVGTAAHARFEEAIRLDNERYPEPRWISEKKVTVRHDLSGTCDLFDTHTNTVIDLKFPGSAAFAHYRRNGPSLEYRTQAHLYGAGYREEGYRVETVGIWFLPRAGQLASSHLWTEPYSPAVVSEALARIDLAHSIIDQLAIDQTAVAENLDMLPRTPHNCQFCPYWSPVSHLDPTACPGEEEWDE